MKVTYELTHEDLASLIEYHQRSSPTARQQRRGCLAVGFGAMLILPGVILMTRDKPVLATAVDIWPLLLGPILFALLANPYIRWRTRQMSNRLLSEGQNNGFYGPCELEAGPEVLIETRPSGSTTRNWSSVERVVMTPSHLFAYTSGTEAYVVPRRAFREEAEFRALADTIADRSGVSIQQDG